MRPGIEYGDAPRRREPEPAVDGAIPAAADRVAGRALRASESILQAVVDGLQARAAAGCKIIKLPPGDAANAAGRAQPQRFAVVSYVGHIVAQQTVFFRELRKPAVAV